MSAELFRTVITIPPTKKHLSYNSGILLFGSCFTENIGERLKWYKFSVNVNPYGISYNPISVLSGLKRLISGNNYQPGDISFYNDLFFSFDHHSRFSDINKDHCLQKINTSFEIACAELKKANFLFITFGTANCYYLKENNSLVNNCHKLPDKEFSRSRLSVDDIVKGYSDFLPQLKKFNNDIHIVFTVSPIRHWKDGAHENQVSKSVLFVALDEILRQFNFTSYFPAYELLMDELRDYRFYEEDMLHPNKSAIDFIWNRFFQCYISRDSQSVMKEIEKIQLAKQHRPFNLNSPQHQQFIKQNLTKIELLSAQFPNIDFNEELEYFRSNLL